MASSAEHDSRAWTAPEGHPSLDAARAWICDCFEDAPADLTDLEVVRAIDRHYEGGWERFVLEY